MLGRQVLVRLRSTAPVAQTWALPRNRGTCTPASCLVRFYATPGRPRSTVGEPSRTVKRAVKRQAKGASSGEKTASKKATKATPAKKPTTRQRPVTEKAKAAKAAKEEKQRLAKEAKKQKDKLERVKKREKQKVITLKEKALHFPFKTLARSARIMHLMETMPATTGTFGERMSMVHTQFKALTPAEVEHYNHLAVQANLQREADIKKFVEAHTVEQIKAANLARNTLNRKYPAFRRLAKIPEHRVPRKKPAPFGEFVRARWASGDMKSLTAPQAMSLIAKEWKVLTASEKSNYAQ